VDVSNIRARVDTGNVVFTLMYIVRYHQRFSLFCYINVLDIVLERYMDQVRWVYVCIWLYNTH